MGELEFKFDSETNLENWLEKRSHEDAVVLSARSALRSVPYLDGLLDKNASYRRANLILPNFRALVVATAGYWGVEEMADAAKSAVLFSNPAEFVIHNDYQSTALFAGLSAVESFASFIFHTHVPNSATYFVNAAYFAARSINSNIEFADLVSADAWNTVSLDAQAIDSKSIESLPLWHNDHLNQFLAYWHRLREALLSAEDEDWAVWTDWYEARLRGDPIDIDLERAKALIPEEIWEQGPKVANAEIRRLIDEHAAKKRAKAEEQVSPSPVIGADGKLDAVPTPGIDISDDSPDLPELLRRQRANIDIILNAVETMPGNEFRTVPRALSRYDTEVADHSLRLSVDYLNDVCAIARSEYLSLYRDKFFDTEAGLRRGFLNFFALHKTILTHYPLDAERRALLESFDNPVERPDPAKLDEAIEDVTEGLASAIEAEAVTQGYASYMRGMMEDISHITYTPPLAGISTQTIDPQIAGAPSPLMKLAKQLYLKVAAFSGATVRTLRKLPSSSTIGNALGIAGFIQTPWGKPFFDALISLRDLLWSLFF